MRALTPETLGPKRLREMRGNTRFELELPPKALARGVPAKALRRFLAQWQTMWPYHGWFLSPEDPLLGLLALAASEKFVAAYRSDIKAVNWYVAWEDLGRLRHTQNQGICAIANLCKADNAEFSAQLAAVEWTLGLFIKATSEPTDAS